MKNKIKKSELVEMIHQVIKEETGYQEFFKSALKKFGVNSPADLDDDKKKEFFNYVDANWEGKGEVEETLEPVSPAQGNPLKRVKAKKRDQILAQEAQEKYIRKLVREELKFVLFSEVPSTASRKVAKKRITQSGGKTL